MRLFIGLIIPLIGTSLGASVVFFMKKEINKELEKILLGFAGGVMMAASIWSLLIPSTELVEAKNNIAWLPATIGFFLGIIFLLIIEKFVKVDKDSKLSMMLIAVTIHNIPEGMAVGVAFAGALFGNNTIIMAEALALSIGIAIQNFPEGAIISMPLKSKGFSKWKSFKYGFLSGVVEPIFSVFTILCTKLVLPVLPYLLSFAAGSMIYVVIKELIPEAEDGKSNRGIVGFSIGFALMMILDVALG